MYKKLFLRTRYVLLLIPLFLRAERTFRAFLPTGRGTVPVAHTRHVYIEISSYREPFYLMYDPTNAIDKTARLSLTLYGDRFSRSDLFFFRRRHRRKSLRDNGKSTCILSSPPLYSLAVNGDDAIVVGSNGISLSELTILFVSGVNLSPPRGSKCRKGRHHLYRARYPGIKFEENHY